MTPRSSGRHLLWAGLRQNPVVVAALGMLALLSLVAVFADVLASDKPVIGRIGGRIYLLPALTQPVALRNENIQSLRLRLAQEPDGWMLEPVVPYGVNQPSLQALSPPSAEHLLGTDDIGRDVLAWTIHGCRISLSVGLLAVGLYVFIGVLVGALAGFYRGKVDLVISRVIEVMLTFPTFFFILCIQGLIRVKTLFPLMVIIGLTRWPDVARLVRAEILKLRELEFVQASRALGASDARLIFRHLIPNALGPVLVSAAFGVAGAILIESSLAFLGFGPQAASWGQVLAQARQYVTHPGAWWLTLFPGATLFLTITAFNVVGEGLRDALDPRMQL